MLRVSLQQRDILRQEMEENTTILNAASLCMKLEVIVYEFVTWSSGIELAFKLDVSSLIPLRQ